MKKGKSRNKRKKTRSRLLWIAIAVIGIAAVISAVCVAGMLETKENAWRTQEELLVEYMYHIPKKEYEEMYAMLHVEVSGSISQEDFIKRNSAIYEGIEVQNMAVRIIAYDEEQMTVTYQTSFDTVAGTISFENEALFLKDEERYKLVWDDSMIFRNLTSTDKVRVSTTQAERGEILDRNGRVLAGKGTASSVGIVPGKLENREEAIAQIAELLEITPEAIEKKLSAKWVKDDSFVPIKTIPRVKEIELMSISPDEEVLENALIYSDNIYFAIVASKKYKNIVIIQPTLALLDETRLKLKKYADDYKIIVRTSQPYSEDKRNLFLLTAERVMEYEPLPQIDFLIIDEFYKLSLRRKDDRADTLNNAFLKVVNKFHSRFYFLGPNIDGITDGFAEKYDAIFYKSDFSLVDCNVIDKSNLINWSNSDKQIDKEKITILCELLDELRNEQTLIYCSTPARARRMAKVYLEYLQRIGREKNNQLPLIEWINKNVSPKWSLAKELQYGVAIHDGSLQKHIGASIIKYFNEGRLNCIFCTSTIIEGVNTSAKNVILFDEKKGGNEIDFFDYSNIKGRSGRMMEHYVGRIFNFCHVPVQKAIVIDRKKDNRTSTK